MENKKLIELLESEKKEKVKSLFKTLTEKSIEEFGNVRIYANNENVYLLHFSSFKFLHEFGISESRNKITNLNDKVLIIFDTERCYRVFINDNENLQTKEEFERYLFENDEIFTLRNYTEIVFNNFEYKIEKCTKCNKRINVTLTSEAKKYKNKWYCKQCYEEIFNKIVGNIEGLDVKNINSMLTDEIDYNASSKSLDSYHEYDRNFRIVKDNKESLKALENGLFKCGVELEINTSHSSAVNGFLTKNLNGFGARDGSISGVEFIFDVHTLKAFHLQRERLEKCFTYIMNNYEANSDNSECGIHIHVSRSCLGKTKEKQENVIANIELFISNFTSEIQKFARRSSSSYCKYLRNITTLNDSNEYYSKKKLSKIKKSNDTRYLALNTQNTNTIEFRFFKGSLNINTFIANIELIHNIVEICKRKKMSGLTWDYVINLNNFEDLKTCNARREIISNTKFKDLTKSIAKKQKTKELKMIEETLKFGKRLETFINNYNKLEKIVNKMTKEDANYKVKDLISEFISPEEENLRNEKRRKISNVFSIGLDLINYIHNRRCTYTLEETDFFGKKIISTLTDNEKEEISRRLNKFYYELDKINDLIEEKENLEIFGGVL